MKCKKFANSFVLCKVAGKKKKKKKRFSKRCRKESSSCFYLSLDGFISNFRGVSFVFLISLLIIEINPTLNANNIDPNRMPHPVASYLDIRTAFYNVRFM